MTDQQPIPPADTDSQTPDPPGILTLLTNRNFSAVFMGGLISDIGSFFTFIAMMFLAIDITRDLPLGQSAQAIALITLFFILPTLFIGPFTGAVVDRFDRKKIMYIADIFGVFASLGLVYVAVVSRQISHIYLFAFITTMVRLFFYPARGASIPVIVDKPEALVKANGIVQIMAQMSRIIGPALAGIIISQFNLQIAFVIDAISYLVSAILIFSIRTDLRPKPNGKISPVTILSDLKIGAILVKNDRVMLFMMGFFMVAIFGIGMIDPLFAVYLSRNLGLNESEFGFILSLSAISGLLSALVLTGKGEISRKLTFTVSSTIIAGISLVILGLAQVLPFHPRVWLYVGMAMIGAINVLVSIPFQALMQTIIKNEHLGKINGFISTGIALSQVGGAALASYFAIFLTIELIYASVGLFMLIVAALGLLVIKLLGLETEAQEREQQAIAEAQQTDEGSTTGQLSPQQVHPIPSSIE